MLPLASNRCSIRSFLLTCWDALMYYHLRNVAGSNWNRVSRKNWLWVYELLKMKLSSGLGSGQPRHSSGGSHTPTPSHPHTHTLTPSYTYPHSHTPTPLDPSRASGSLELSLQSDASFLALLLCILRVCASAHIDSSLKLTHMYMTPQRQSEQTVVAKGVITWNDPL